MEKTNEKIKKKYTRNCEKKEKKKYTNYNL